MSVSAHAVAATIGDADTNRFGDQIPNGDPSWYQGLDSPYYNASHRAWRAKLRAFIDDEVIPNVSAWEKSGDYPQSVVDKAYAAGIYGALWPVKYGGTPPPGMDAFHDLIFWDEIARCGAGGLMASIFLTPSIALPVILKGGSEALKNRIARNVITGKQFISLAVTEPDAGSDVANLTTTATKSACGQFYIVNGSKKFITTGMKAQYFTTAVRTGGPGLGGISILVIEKGMPGVVTRRQKTQGWYTSTTTFVTFEDVQVPIGNLVGKEHRGFYLIMTNFNHERFAGCVGSVRYARVCLEESLKYARVRKTFGKRLIDHQVIRHKLAEMARMVESSQALVENLCYQMKMHNERTSGADGVFANDVRLGGPLALCKVQCTKTYEFCAREASQIFGGNSYIRGGVGETVERLYREVRVAAIGAGSEEIMLDLWGRQAKL